MEILAIIVALILGWQRGTFGEREVKAIAIIVAGWTAAMVAAAIAHLSLAYIATLLVTHTLAIAVPYGLAVLVKRIVQRR